MTDRQALRSSISHAVGVVSPLCTNAPSGAIGQGGRRAVQLGTRRIHQYWPHGDCPPGFSNHKPPRLGFVHPAHITPIPAIPPSTHIRRRHASICGHTSPDNPTCAPRPASPENVWRQVRGHCRHAAARVHCAGSTTSGLCPPTGQTRARLSAGNLPHASLPRAPAAHPRACLLKLCAP